MDLQIAACYRHLDEIQKTEFKIKQLSHESAAQITYLFASFNSLDVVARSLNCYRREVQMPHRLNATIREPAFDDVVTTQRENPVVDEDRAGLAVPVDTGGEAMILNAPGGWRIERAG